MLVGGIMATLNDINKALHEMNDLHAQNLIQNPQEYATSRYWKMSELPIMLKFLIGKVK